jgi:hypothetical protein
MDMGMKPDLLIPSVQHAEETNLCTEVSGIASDFEKSFRAGTKQEIADHPWLNCFNKHSNFGCLRKIVEKEPYVEIFNPQLNPQFEMSCMACTAFGNPRLSYKLSFRGPPARETP